MSAAKTKSRKSKTKRGKISSAKAKNVTPKRSKTKRLAAKKTPTKPQRKTSARIAPSRKARAGVRNKSASQPRVAAPSPARAFRFTAADTVQIRFAGARAPTLFRVDDMAEASLITLDGVTNLYYQFRLVAAEPGDASTGDRHYWFFDPAPVCADDSIGPTLWTPVGEQHLDDLPSVREHTGRFSTKSITSYDGSGNRHTVRVDDKPTYRMRFEFNGHLEFCESLPVTVGDNDILTARAG